MAPGHRLGVTACATATATAVWVLGVSRNRARAGAVAYADRLVAACEAFADHPPSAGASGPGKAKQNLESTSAGYTGI